jgi:iron complex outermembrane recepter protein
MIVPRSLLPTLALCAAIAILAVCSPAALAQRADANPVTSASDAFGLAVGGQTLGIYDADNVRGFDPRQLGNLRLNGLYSDRQAPYTWQLIQSLAIKVGSTATSYIFPAPSGLVDYSLHEFPQQDSASITAGINPLISPYMEVDIAERSSDRLALIGGIALYPRINALSGNYGAEYSGALTAIAHLTPSLTLSAFDNVLFEDRVYRDPIIYLADSVLPPRRARDADVGQRWTVGEGKINHSGLLVDWSGALGWSARVGLISSKRTLEVGYDQVFDRTDASGETFKDVYAYRGNFTQSRSGEARLTREWKTGAIAHRIDLSIRGRDRDRDTGRQSLYHVGAGSIYAVERVPQPSLESGAARSRNTVRQSIVGVAYRAEFARFVALSAGLQRSDCTQDFISSLAEPSREQSQSTLATLTLGVPITRHLALYSSYSEGLEEGGIAPPDAANRYEVLPVIEARQTELGLQYAIDRYAFVAGAFDLKKPYAERDAQSVYRVIGELRNRGIEASLKAAPLHGFTAVAGLMVLDPEVTLSEFAGMQYPPLGIARRELRLSLDYVLPWLAGVSVDLDVRSRGKVAARANDELDLPGYTTVDAGLRWRLQLLGKPSTARFQIQNLGDTFAWTADKTGGLGYTPPRTYVVALTMSL